MILLLMVVERADADVDCLGRQSLLHDVCLLIGSVDITGREIGITPVLKVWRLSRQTAVWVSLAVFDTFLV